MSTASAICYAGLFGGVLAAALGRPLWMDSSIVVVLIASAFIIDRLTVAA